MRAMGCSLIKFYCIRIFFGLIEKPQSTFLGVFAVATMKQVVMNFFMK